MRLDSKAYQWLHWFRRKVGLRAGPNPIIWGDPKPIPQPSPELLNRLTDSELRNLRLAQNELKILSQISHVPSALNDYRWLQLAKQLSLKERYDSINFFSKTDHKAEKDELDRQKRVAAKLEREANREPKPENNMSGLFYLPYGQIDALEKDITLNRQWRSHRLEGERPAIAVDCRYLSAHSTRGCNLTFLQLAHILALNRERPIPWRMSFVNFDISKEMVRSGTQRHLHVLPRDVCEVTERSYTDLYPRESLIYLSPHADTNLSVEEVRNETNCFIIGGIVDRVREPNIPLYASRSQAEIDGIQCRKFPLREYIDWKSGHTYLTLNASMTIIQDLYEIGDWKTVLERNIPRRNKTTLQGNVKKLQSDNHQRKRELLALLRERVGYH